MMLALCMFFTPAALTASDCEITPATITLESADGLSLSGGLTLTADGSPAIFLDASGNGLSATGDTAYVTIAGTSYAVPVEELLQLLAASSMSVPAPTEEDMMALMAFATGLLSNAPRDAVSMSVIGNGLSFSVNVDKLCDYLHTGVPTMLNTYASYLDPVLEKYSPYLFGEVITSAQLAEVWPQLGLDQVETGFSAQLSVIQSRNSVMLIGQVADVSFMATISESNLSATVTTADGTIYAIDTADFATIAAILAEVPQQITTDAFSVVETNTVNESSHRIDTLTCKLDTTTLSRDLNRGLAYTFAMHSTEVDQLLNKYRSWFALTDESLAERLSARFLIDTFNKGTVFLPALTGELCITCNQRTRDYTVDGYLGAVTLNGVICTNSMDTTASFTLAYPDRYNDFVLSLDYSESYDDGLTCTVHCSENLLGFRTLTFYMNDIYGWMSWNLTTDTNVLRATYSDFEQHLELKLGAISASLRVDANDALHFDLYSPQFFTALHVDESSFNLDTTLGGIDYAENREGFVLNGYLIDFDSYYHARTAFGLSYVDSWNESSVTGYLNTSSGESYRMSLHANGIDLFLDGTEYAIRPVKTDDPNKTTLTIAENGEIIMTYVLTETRTTVIAQLYDGTDVSEAAVPMYTLTLDLAPEAFVAPADATVVDAMTFLEKLITLLD
ncbi:MAG: hypothetical protein ACI4MG_08040 [Aristaeellaceae bacterium]